MIIFDLDFEMRFMNFIPVLAKEHLLEFRRRRILSKLSAAI